MLWRLVVSSSYEAAVQYNKFNQFLTLHPTLRYNSCDCFETASRWWFSFCVAWPLFLPRPMLPHVCWPLLQDSLRASLTRCANSCLHWPCRAVEAVMLCHGPRRNGLRPRPSRSTRSPGPGRIRCPNGGSHIFHFILTTQNRLVQSSRFPNFKKKIKPHTYYTYRADICWQLVQLIRLSSVVKKST